MIPFFKRHPVVLTIPVLVLGWWLAARLELAGPSLLASPREVAAVFGRAFHFGAAGPSLFHHAAESFCT